VTVTEAPAARSVMLEYESSIGSFCLGEVVVTTASVMLDDSSGWASVLGFDEAGALAAAICEARRGDETDALAEHALELEEEEGTRLQAAVARTEVSLR
jgi:alpha-D-ribose 1-methylphosphonate 5-triphosphate synthase subunit PhnG